MSFSHLDPTTPEEAWQAAGIAQLPVLPPHILEQADYLVVIGAHPDDEALGCAALIATAAHTGVSTHVVSYTRGEGSHPHSPTHRPPQLAQRRQAEFQQAMRLLHPQASVDCALFPDGQLYRYEPSLKQSLTELVQSKPGTVVLAAPYHQDGHTDHETLGHLARQVAKQAGITLLEYPIWYWHWADPKDASWQYWRRLSDPVSLNRAELYAAYPSQLQPLSDEVGDEALLTPEFMTHFHRGFDTLVVSEHSTYDARDAAAVFDQLHTTTSDPWQLATSTYEQQKRQALLTAVGSGYRHTLEVGCSIGTLSAGLAVRSAHVTAIDASQAAIATAQHSYGAAANISFECLTVPFEWPDGTFDLVVLSEVGYFLAPDQLETTLRLIQRSTSDTFTLALCHVLGEIKEWPADAVSVHEQCRKFWPGATVMAAHHTQEYVLEVWHISKQSEDTAGAQHGR